MFLTIALPVSAATVLPELRLESRYDDNVLHRPNGSDDLVSVVTPGLTIFNRDPVTSYEALGRMGFTSYRRTDAKTSRLDVASLWVNHRPGRFEELDALVRHVHSVDPIDFSQGVVTTRGDVTTTQSRGSLDFFRVGGSGRYNRWDYAAGDASDGSSLDWSGRLYPVNTEVTRLAAQFRHRELRVRDAISLEANYQTLALQRHHSENVTSEFEAGRVEVDDAQHGGKRVRPAVAFEIRRRGADVPLTMRFRVADDVATTLDGGLGYASGGRLLSLQYETALDAEGGLYRVATLTRRATLGVADTLWSGQVLELNTSFGRTRPLHGAEPQVDLWRAGAAVSSPIGSWLTGRLGWDFVRQDAPAGGTSAEFDRNRYSVSVIAGPRP